jgi:hypothetical protein
MPNSAIVSGTGLALSIIRHTLAKVYFLCTKKVKATKTSAEHGRGQVRTSVSRQHNGVKS